MPLLESLKMAPQIEEETDEELAQDPVPHEKPVRPARKGTRTRRVTPPAKPSVAKLAKQVAEDLTTLIEGGAAVWGLQDQCCAPVLETQAKPIAEALTAILARNPRLLEKFANTDIAVYTMQSAALFKALAPVGRSVYSNHISKTSGEGHHDDGDELERFPVYRPV